MTQGFRLPLLFALLTMIVGLTSTFDAYLNLKYPVVVALELNPLARWILQDNGDGDHARAVMLSLKFAGTMAVIVILWLLFHFPSTRFWAWIIVGAISAFQVSVLCYMTEGFQFL